MTEAGPPQASTQPVADRGVALKARHLLRQFVAFFGVGVVAAVVHYSVLYSMVEAWFYDPVSASLAGYLAGGLVSYVLNRIFTYEARRGHMEAGWRFAVVAGVGFVMTWGLMKFLHGHWGWYYLLAQLATTGIVLVWSFLAHKFWSFGEGV